MNQIVFLYPDPLVSPPQFSQQIHVCTGVIPCWCLPQFRCQFCEMTFTFLSFPLSVGGKIAQTTSTEVYTLSKISQLATGFTEWLKEPINLIFKFCSFKKGTSGKSYSHSAVPSRLCSSWSQVFLLVSSARETHQLLQLNLDFASDRAPWDAPRLHYSHLCSAGLSIFCVQGEDQHSPTLAQLASSALN